MYEFRKVRKTCSIQPMLVLNQLYRRLERISLPWTTIKRQPLGSQLSVSLLQLAQSLGYTGVDT